MAGTDANPQETAGVFDALVAHEQGAPVQRHQRSQPRRRSIAAGAQDLSYSARHSLAAGEQGLSAAQTQLTSNNTQLQQLLSNDDDADMATVISNLTEAQTAFEASLQAMAQMFKMTLLNYIS